MKKLILCFISILSTASIAQSSGGPLRVDIDKMTYTHGGGGGSFNIELELDGNNVIAKTTACRRKSLSIKEQEETQIITANTELVEIMKNNVIIAKNVAIQAPRPRGIWKHLRVDYTSKESIEVYGPIIIINGSISYVLNDIMSKLRENTSHICK